MPAPKQRHDFREDAASLVELLSERFSGGERQGVVLIDEADALVEADAKHNSPLLAELRTIQTEGVCSFVLIGYWHLYRRTLDHASPLYNFAPVRRLGPLDPEAGYALASEPMNRVGVSYGDSELPRRIFERVGGYPNLIQLLCHQLLKQLKQGRTLSLTTEHLKKAERSQEVRDYLVRSFRVNTLPAAQIAVYRLLELDSFTLSEAHISLEDTVEREIPLTVLESLLLQLVLYGFVSELEDRYKWTIPLLRDCLLSGDRRHRIARLVEELPDDPAFWPTMADPRRSKR